MRQLQGPKASASLWVLASTAFPRHSTPFLAHARALLKGRPSARWPPKYDVFGPLPVGKNEVDGDPLAGLGGAFEHWLSSHTHKSRADGAPPRLSLYSPATSERIRMACGDRFAVRAIGDEEAAKKDVLLVKASV